MDYGPLHEEPFAQSQRGVFITCEGNFGWDNASLSFYDPAARSVENEIFIRANGMKLGDVAQFHAVRADEDFVFDAPCCRIVERQRSVVPAEVALARDEHAALRLRERLFMQRSVVHAGAAESCAGA